MQIPVDTSLVEALAAASSHGHYIPPPELSRSLVAAATQLELGDLELISQFELHEHGLPRRWLEWMQWSYLSAAGTVLCIVAPPTVHASEVVERMERAVEGSARLCMTILPLSSMRNDLGTIACKHTVGISLDTQRWQLLREGTKRRDHAVCVLVTDTPQVSDTMKGLLRRHFWFNEPPQERQ